MPYDSPRYLDCGEAALSVEFGDAVDPAIHARVLALDAALQHAPPAGLRETTPSYRALLIHYEPLDMSRAELVAHIESLEVAGVMPTAPRARWALPCCYDPSCGEDIAEAAAALSLSVESLSAAHAGAGFRAYMYGFAPGWLYLGGLPSALAVPRRATPRGPTPQGAVLIGGGLSLIATNPMPTGWYVVGRTPERLFDATRAPPCRIAPGDAVSFESVDAATFAALDARAAAGESLARAAP